MLFAIDVGNTNFTIGLFDGEELIKTFRMITKTSRTSDEYGVFFGEWLPCSDPWKYIPGCYPLHPPVHFPMHPASHRKDLSAMVH